MAPLWGTGVGVHEFHDTCNGVDVTDEPKTIVDVVQNGFPIPDRSGTLNTRRIEEHALDGIADRWF